MGVVKRAIKSLEIKGKTEFVDKKRGRFCAPAFSTVPPPLVPVNAVLIPLIERTRDIDYKQPPRRNKMTTYTIQKEFLVIATRQSADQVTDFLRQCESLGYEVNFNTLTATNKATPEE